MPCAALLAVGLNLQSIRAADLTAEEHLANAQSTLRIGDLKTAGREGDQAVALAPNNALAHMVRGRVHSEAGEGKKAVASYTRALELDPSRSALYQWRGSEQFKLGHIKESIQDFDTYLERFPDQEPHHWQRGISYYYAGQYKEGRRQFESHQTVNGSDVENAVWHFLCVAAVEDPDQAREVFIPITGDRRVPMAEVHALFQGKGDAATVMKAAEAGDLTPERKRMQLFYAHLYLGLYYEAMKDDAKAREHILKAAELSESANYMGAVARVHADRLKK